MKPHDIIYAAALLCGPAMPARADDVVPSGVMQQLLKQIRTDVPDMRECKPAKGWPFEAQALDLNGDGKPEYVLTANSECGCGEANCSQWIYRQGQSRWELILETAGYDLAANPASHNGYRDVDVASRDNAAIIDHLHYVFNGRRYAQSEGAKENLETGQIKADARRVRFAKGTSSAIVTGSADVGFGDSWMLGAGKGQTMHLALQPVKKGDPVVMTLLGPQSAGGHVIADRVKQWSGVLPASGDYTILVDTEGDRRAAYGLTVGID